MDFAFNIVSHTGSELSISASMTQVVNTHSGNDWNNNNRHELELSFVGKINKADSIFQKNVIIKREQTPSFLSFC